MATDVPFLHSCNSMKISNRRLSSPSLDETATIIQLPTATGELSFENAYLDFSSKIDDKEPRGFKKLRSCGIMQPLKNSTYKYQMVFQKFLRGFSNLIKFPKDEKKQDSFAKPKVYECDYCFKYFSYHLIPYLKHLKRRHMEELFICEICGKKLPNHEKLFRHQSRRHIPPIRR